MPTSHYQRKPFSQERKDKIRKALIGNKNAVGNKSSVGRSPWNKGKTDIYSEDVLKAISAKQKGKRNSPRTEFKKGIRVSIATEFKKGRPGYLTSNWKGGVTSESEKLRKSDRYKLWRLSVFERDNFTCKCCGERGGKLHADHIKPWSLFQNLRFDISNGRTLCIPCHKKTPTYLCCRKKLEEMFIEERGSYGDA